MYRFLCMLLLACLAAQPSWADKKNEELCWGFVHAGNRALWRYEPTQAWEQYHKARLIALELEDDFLYAHSLLGLGQAIWYTGRFHEAADTVRLSVKYFRRARAKMDQATALRILSNIYDDIGDYESAFKTTTEGLELYKGSKNNFNYVLSLVQMGALYRSMGDFETALAYYRRAEQLGPTRAEYPYRELYHRMGELYAAMGRTEEAKGFYARALEGNAGRKLVRMRLGNLYLQEKNYDLAFRYFDSLHKEARRITDINIIIGSMLGLGKVYLVRHQLDSALKMTYGSLEQSSQGGARQPRQKAYELLAEIYEAKGDNSRALAYHKQQEALKDSIVTDNFRRKMFSFRQEAEAERLKGQRNVLVLCIAGVCILGLFAFFIISLRYKNENLSLQQRAAELEMKSLRAQMNPHFIFNCLSSINHFILNEESDKASEYLTRFSRLIRTVLVNAGKTTVTLEEELAMLRLYLNMEQLRFKEAFDYSIEFEPGVEPSMIFVPSFILQPFCENAIWHGLLHKDGKGRLSIHFSMKNDVLVCTIKDNGIGRERAAAYKSAPVEKVASFGNRLSAERLALFNDDLSGASFVTEDIRNSEGEVAGTSVILKIKNKQVHD
ncbi:histidine kinase [Chitinophaga sp.]|uniref:tetratricopeptide repeat-containing sensor histidine kinase n=1 Tax=Chitinophaga sp. TaxID=1869181 RepID=UPI0031DACD18